MDRSIVFRARGAISNHRAIVFILLKQQLLQLSLATIARFWCVTKEARIKTGQPKRGCPVIAYWRRQTRRHRRTCHHGRARQGTTRPVSPLVREKRIGGSARLLVRSHRDLQAPGKIVGPWRDTPPGANSYFFLAGAPSCFMYSMPHGPTPWIWSTVSLSLVNAYIGMPAGITRALPGEYAFAFFSSNLSPVAK